MLGAVRSRIGLAFFVLCLGACSSSDRSSTASPPPASVPNAPGSPGTIQKKVNISIPMNATGMGSAAFGANPLIIPAGALVTWKNDDNVSHTVTSEGGMFDSGIMIPGQSFSWTAPTSGEVAYHCEIHPMMRGALRIESGAGVVATMMIIMPPGAMNLENNAYDPNPVNVKSGMTVT